MYDCFPEPKIIYNLFNDEDDGAVTVIHVDAFDFTHCWSFFMMARKNESARLLNDVVDCRCCCSDPFRSNPLILSALINGKHDSDFGRGNCDVAVNLDLFLPNKLTSDSLSSLGLWAESVNNSLTAFNSDWKSSRGQTILGFFPILFKRSAAIDSIVRRINGYISSTALKCSTDNENRLQYVSARTLATRRALVSKQISENNQNYVTIN